MRRDLTCAQIRELLPRWTDGELSHAEQRRFEGHLQTCDACRSLAEAHRRVHEGLELLGRVADRIADRPLVLRPPAAPLLRYRRFARIAAGIVLIAGAAVWLATSLQRDRHDARVRHVGAKGLPPSVTDSTPNEGQPPATAALVQVALFDGVDYLQTRIETRNPHVHVVWLYPTLPAEPEPVTQ